MAQMYEVTLKGTYQQQQVINRLCFTSDVDTPSTTNAFALGRALGLLNVIVDGPLEDSVLEAYLACQTDLFQMDEILIRNLFNPTDFYTAALSGVTWRGSNPAGTAALMPFVASKLQTNRINTEIARGSLALTPFTEAAYDNSGVLNEGSLAVLQELCDRLNEPPSAAEDSDVTNFIPTVFQKEEYDVPDSGTPPRKAYRYYTDPAIQAEHSAVGVTWFPKNRATSQTSRRFGKGA